MIPNIIHFSLPASTSQRQKEIIEIARSKHPDWQLKLWHDGDAIEGARLRHYLSKANSGAQRSDLIRLEVVYAYGGFYLDSDMLLLRPLDSLRNFSELIMCSEDGYHLTNAFFAAPPRSNALNAIIETLVINEPDWELPPNQTTGPDLFASVLRFQSGVTLLPRETFYPYNWNESRPNTVAPRCYAIHEWEMSWKSDKQRRARNPSLAFGSLGKTLLKRLQPSLQKTVAAVIPNNLTHPSWSHRALYFYGQDNIALTRYNLRMLLPGDDLSVTPSIALTGELEPVEEKFVAAIVKGGDWVIEIGANVGLFTLIAAKACGPFGRVFAIEASERWRNYIEKSSKLNQFHDRIAVFSFAIFDTERTDFHKKTSNRLEATPENEPIIESDQSASSTNEIANIILEGKQKRLDHMFSGNVPIKLVKIDVDGDQVNIIRKLQIALRTKSVQFLMIKISRETTGAFLNKILNELNHLKQYSYSAYLLQEDASLVKVENFQHHIPQIGRISVVFQAHWGD